RDLRFLASECCPTAPPRKRSVEPSVSLAPDARPRLERQLLLVTAPPPQPAPWQRSRWLRGRLPHRPPPPAPTPGARPPRRTVFGVLSVSNRRRVPRRSSTSGARRHR